jgi:hypothetical protein
MQSLKMVFWNDKTIRVDGGHYTVGVFVFRNKTTTQFQVEFQREGDFEFFVEKIQDSGTRGEPAGQRGSLRDANYPRKVLMSVNGNELCNALVILLRFAADELEKQGKEN